MIFVTVGTHEQPFNRLIQKVDELKKRWRYNRRCHYSDGFQYIRTKILPVEQVDSVPAND